MFTKAFAIAAAERAIKTFAQTALGFFVIGTTGLIGLDYVSLLSVSGAAAVASVLTSLVSGMNGSGPSLTHVETIDDAPKHLAD